MSYERLYGRGLIGSRLERSYSCLGINRKRYDMITHIPWI